MTLAKWLSPRTFDKFADLTTAGLLVACVVGLCMWTSLDEPKALRPVGPALFFAGLSVIIYRMRLAVCRWLRLIRRSWQSDEKRLTCFRNLSVRQRRYLLEMVELTYRSFGEEDPNALVLEKQGFLYRQTGTRQPKGTNQFGQPIHHVTFCLERWALRFLKEHRESLRDDCREADK